MNNPFEPYDPERDRQCLKDYFFKTYMSNNPYLDKDEQVARENMFDKLAELGKVVADVKKGLKKKK